MSSELKSDSVGSAEKAKQSEGESRKPRRRAGKAGSPPITTGSSGTSKQTKFDGKCEELKGHIFDCTDVRQSDQYSRTVKEIAEYVGRTYKYGADARMAVEQLARPTIEVPNDPLTMLRRLNFASGRRKSTSLLRGKHTLMKT
jgi:hypothetical protein